MSISLISSKTDSLSSSAIEKTTNKELTNSIRNNRSRISYNPILMESKFSFNNLK